jgi:hypothetical protein
MPAIPSLTVLLARWGATGLSLALLSTACSDFLGPDRGDPAQYAFTDSVFYACGSWHPAPPTSQLGLFDIPSGPASEAESFDEAKRRLIDRVLEANGTIVRRYNVVMVRAILPVNAIPGLQVSTVYGVVELNGDVVKVFVGFHGAIERSAIEARGGTVLQEYGAFGIVLAMISDHQVPALLRDLRVSFVEQALSKDCLI